MITEATIQSAIDDLRIEGIDALTEIATDYGIKPEVLRSRFERAFPNGVPAPVDVKAKIEESIVATCARYGVPRSAAIGPITTKHNRRVTVICHTRSRYIVVDMTTGEVRELGFNLIGAASLRYAKVAA